MYETIDFILTRSANRHPGKIFFRWEEGAVTYGRMNQRVNRWAAFFKGVGVGPGERVCLLFHNGPAMVEAMWAAFKLGATAVPLNFRLAREELKALVAHSQAGWLVISDEFEEITRGLMEDSKGGPGRVIYQQEPSLAEQPPGSDSSNWEDSSNPGDYYDPALILYTAGTTAASKGVVLTHGNLLWNAFHLITANNINRSDVVLHPSPLFHSAALGRMMAVMMVGGTFITMSKYDPRSVLQAIPEHKVTIMAAAPTMYHQLFQVPEINQYDLDSVAACVSGASQLQPDLLEKFKNYFPRARIFSMYGLTEASPSCTVLSPELVYEKPGSVGRPQEGVELRIVDDDGRDVAAGEVGEIIIRGPNVTSLYWNAPEVTAEAIRHGWLYTGDMARMDGDGDIYIVDRKKDMIITGGENVYSAEVENVLRSHRRVSEAAVIGLPDEQWGESVCAVVVLEGGNDLPPEELVEHCKKHIASYKKPKKILFREDLPKNPAGKVIKNEVKEWALKQG